MPRLTNDTLNVMIEDLKEFMSSEIGHTNDKIDAVKYELTETLNRIDAQVQKTNGRVTSIERWIEQAKGAVKLGGLLISVIVALVVYIWHAVGGF